MSVLSLSDIKGVHVCAAAWQEQLAYRHSTVITQAKYVSLIIHTEQYHSSI